MCEWARKFVLRTSRLPTDEETCTSLASLMKEPLPAHVPTALPYMAEDYSGAPGGPQAPFAGAGDTPRPPLSKTKTPPLSPEQQPAGATPMSSGSTAIGTASSGTDPCTLPGIKCSQEQQGGAAPGLCKKRKESAQTAETTTKVRKGSGAQSGASMKKGQTPRAIVEDPSDPAFMNGRRMEHTEPNLAGGSGRPRGGPGECSRDAPQHMLSPFVALTTGEPGTAPYASAVPACGGTELQELPQAEVPPAQEGEGLPPGPPREDEAQGRVREPRLGDSDQPSQEPNPWFEELEQLKKISRPKGGRAKRFNVGKKPFSGVRGIYFQQGLWKVKYRGEQEEAMKLFPYSPGVRDMRKSLLFLRR